MNYKEKYEAALERAREIKSKILSSHLSTESCKAVSEYIDEIIPELAESEGERTTRAINNMLPFIPDEAYANNGVTKETVLNWLEKQKVKEKYDRMAPIYNDQQSFEDALDKAWEFYQKSGSSTVDGCEDNPVEPAFAKGFREGFLCEKQKESLHIHETCKENAKSFIDGIIESKSFQRGVEEGRRQEREKQKEQKSTDEDERIRKEIISIVKAYRENCIDEGSHRFDDCLSWLEKQKPVNFYIPEGIDMNKPKSKIAVIIGQYAARTGMNRDEYYSLLDILNTQQRSVEWSEEDTLHLTNAILSAEKEWGAQSCTAEWLKSLPERFNLQPKVEWSEEDDRICHLIMANLSESARHAITLPMETVNDFNNWLRTLQCMPPVFTDWNEEDQTLLSDALGCVTMVQELKKRGKLKNFHISCSYDELRSWVRSLKSRPRKQPRWKPSEEQMEALDNARFCKSYDRSELDLLYEQLKKLM